MSDQVTINNGLNNSFEVNLKGADKLLSSLVQIFGSDKLFNKTLQRMQQKQISSAETAIQIKKMYAFSESEENNIPNQIHINDHNNYLDIASNAINQINGEVSDLPLDTYWLKQHYEKAKFAQDEEIKKAWAKLLAGEIQNPGTYSIKTMQILEAMTSEDAKLFAKYCSRLVEIQDVKELDNEGIPIDYNGVYVIGFHANILNKMIVQELSSKEMLKLDGLGLIDKSSIGHLPNNNETIYINYEYNSYVITSSFPKKIHIQANVLTIYGEELFQTINIMPDQELSKIFYKLFTPSKGLF